MSDESDDEYLSHPNSSEPPLPEKNQTGSGRYNLRNSGKRVKGYKEYTS